MSKGRRLPAWVKWGRYGPSGCKINRSKRLFDICVVILFAPCWLPVFIATWLIVWCKLGRPVFFRQPRPGLNGRLFTLVKFRTMHEAYDSAGRILGDEARLSKIGRWLRASSVDELPELFSVIRGRMSLVGPRPLLVSYLALYTPSENRRHDVPPGITGWAQVNGRNCLGWAERFELDVWYVENASIGLDVYILMRTVWKVIRRSDISAIGHATMPAFTGSGQTTGDGDGASPH